MCRNYEVSAWLKSYHLIWRLEGWVIKTKNKTKDICNSGEETVHWERRRRVPLVPDVAKRPL